VQLRCENAAVHRIAAGILGVVALGLIGAAGFWLVEFLGAGVDPWARLAIVPAVVALACGLLVGFSAALVWRDSIRGWIGGSVVTIVVGIAWMDFGMRSPGLELPFVLAPWLVIGAIVALTIARLVGGRSPATRV
jgi:uncharacterized membrane protein YeaQ/YmgE (transglycosylase-associated protein family)